MKIDVSELMAKIHKEAEKNNISDSNDGYKLVYPQDGELKVKLLYNPKSGIVMRLTNRHMIGDSRVPCLSQYGKTCPVCQVVSAIENTAPNTPDLWKMKNTRRAIMYAEYLSSTYSISSDEKFNPKKGEVVLLMVPFMVYADLNKIMSDAGNDITELISENTGKVISISRYVEKGRTKYSTSIDGVIDSHKTCDTDEEYDNLLMSLPDLNTKVVPAEFTQEIGKKAEDLARDLSNIYISNRVSSPVQSATEPTTQVIDGMTYTKINGKWVMKQDNSPEHNSPSINTNVSNNQVDNSNHPSCFGHYDENSSKCMICSDEFDCQGV